MAVLRVLAGALGISFDRRRLFWIVLLRKARTRSPPERNLALFVAFGTLGMAHGSVVAGVR